MLLWPVLIYFFILNTVAYTEHFGGSGIEFRSDVPSNQSIKVRLCTGGAAGVPGRLSSPVRLLTQQDLCTQTSGSNLPGREVMRGHAG